MSRRWLITGGSRGLGLAIAKLALRNGDRVAVLARSIVGSLVGELGSQSRCIEGDVADPESMQNAALQVAEAWGGIDVLVNNAGLHRGGKVERLELSDWHAVLSTNLSGPLHCVRAVLPHMPDGGSIVNVGAVVGFRGFPGDSAYAASKAGLSGLTTVLAVELAARQIRVNLVVPGFVMTEMTASIGDKARDRLISRVPLRRVGTEEEIAHVIWWVSGSTYMTGAVIPTDGGLMCQL
jgi:NAD(P)-dependent dehydrogenase (short-subunit alcohol dehydrogenase family)